MKKLLLVLLIVVALTGCGKNEETKQGTNSNTQTETKEQITGNCHATECMKKITTDNTVEEINKIMGFEGELTDEKYNIYTWKISEEESIKVAYYSGKQGYVTADFPNKMIKNDKVDFSNANDMKSKINSSEGLTYEEVVKILGGVEGTLEAIEPNATKYRWVNSNNGVLHAKFNSDGKCTIFNGVF